MLTGKLNQANGRLKAAKVGVVIEQIGDRLFLRATLPPKPNSGKGDPHQQRIALGVYANSAGLSVAEKEARKVGALIACREFQWKPYLKQAVANPTLVKEWVERFEIDYFTRRARNAKSETTWTIDYSRTFNRLLPDDQPLTTGLLTAAIASTTPDSRGRVRACLALGALAKFAGIEIDTKILKGNYSPKRVTPRNLPDDLLIAQTFSKIPNPEWRWVYGMLATFGLRPHEVFLLEPSSDSRVVTVLDGKTGTRRVWAIYPEWMEQFDLQVFKIPEVSGKTNSDIGSRVTQAFRRYDIPFHAYDLRHCWAVRSLEFGLDISLAAQQMGHSTQVHSDLYHHWISDRHHQRAYDLLMLRSDRPLPPQ